MLMDLLMLNFVPSHLMFQLVLIICTRYFKYFGVYVWEWIAGSD